MLSDIICNAPNIKNIASNLLIILLLDTIFSALITKILLRIYQHQPNPSASVPALNTNWSQNHMFQYIDYEQCFSKHTLIRRMTCILNTRLSLFTELVRSFRNHEARLHSRHIYVHSRIYAIHTRLKWLLLAIASVCLYKRDVQKDKFYIIEWSRVELSGFGCACARISDTPFIIIHKCQCCAMFKR